jgi:cell division protein FtsI (penicillin-binding protein 3)
MRIIKNINLLTKWDSSQSNTILRLRITIVFFCILFFILIYRVLIIATSSEDSNFYSQNSTNKFRKEIIDRNGVILAVNLPSSSLFANPTKVINASESLDKLSQILPDINKKKLLEELKTNKNFVWIKRDILPKEQEIIFNLGLVGFDFEREQKRVYTFGNLFSHVIGYVGRDMLGLAGIERYLNNNLINDIDDNNTKSIQLTIDVNLQNILDEELEASIAEFRAKSGVAIVVNPNNGEILAFVNKPDFNPHYPGKATHEQLFNNASLGIYETGSIFKTISLAIGFDTNTITMNDLYDLTYLKIGNNVINDYHKMNGWHSVPEIFLHSSNVGTSQIILEVGEENVKKYFKNLGLLDSINIEIPEKARPIYPNLNKKWSNITLATMSYGYGLSISPLHFIKAMVPIMNGGILHDLTFIKSNNKSPGVRILSQNTSKQMSKLMRLAVEKGTGKKSEIEGYYIGGKTGTAEKLLAGRYLKNSRISSFIAALPAINPEYILYIMLDEPKPTKDTFGFATAGWTAVPLAKRIFQQMISLYSIEPVNPIDIEDIININYKIDDDI